MLLDNGDTGATKHHSLIGDVKRASVGRPLSPRVMRRTSYVFAFLAFFAMLASYSRNRQVGDFRADNRD